MKKFGFDIHGVFDTYSSLKDIGAALIKAGHEVHIMTGAPLEVARKHLNKIGAIQGRHYSHFYSVADTLIDQGVDVTWRDPENPMFEDEVWNKAKAEYCKEKKINMLLDDSPIYGTYFEDMETEYIQVSKMVQK